METRGDLSTLRGGNLGTGRKGSVYRKSLLLDYRTEEYSYPRRENTSSSVGSMKKGNVCLIRREPEDSLKEEGSLRA